MESLHAVNFDLEVCWGDEVGQWRELDKLNKQRRCRREREVSQILSACDARLRKRWMVKGRCTHCCCLLQLCINRYCPVCIHPSGMALPARALKQAKSLNGCPSSSDRTKIRSLATMYGFECVVAQIGVKHQLDYRC